MGWVGLGWVGLGWVGMGLAVLSPHLVTLPRPLLEFPQVISLVKEVGGNYSLHSVSFLKYLQ